MITCTRRFTFCAAHFLPGHPGRCASLHGHNYVVEVAVSRSGGDTLDGLGMVADFSFVKAGVGKWIDEHLDHALIYCDSPGFRLPKAWRRFKMDRAPTAEHMALLVLDTCNKEIFKGSPLRAEEVTIWETENCKATARSGSPRSSGRSKARG